MVEMRKKRPRPLRDARRDILPDGTFPKSVDEYVAAWQEIAEPICKAVGARLCAFDPSLSILGGPNLDQVMELPLWFVRAMNEKLASGKDAPKPLRYCVNVRTGKDEIASSWLQTKRVKEWYSVSAYSCKKPCMCDGYEVVVLYSTLGKDDLGGAFRSPVLPGFSAKTYDEAVRLAAAVKDFVTSFSKPPKLNADGQDRRLLLWAKAQGFQPRLPSLWAKG